MKNKIVKKNSFLLCLLLSTFFFSQIKKINFLIMIDEKPCLMVNNMQLSSNSIGSLDVNYNVGTIDLSDNEYDRVIRDNSLNLDVGFETFLPKHPIAQKYVFSLPKEFLNQKYIIINIFNKDNKIYKKRYLGESRRHKDYYIVITSPDFSKVD